jgi:hypothetical protein
VTMLDAHPNIAMSYEVYERNLFDACGEPFRTSEIIELLATTRQPDDTTWIKQLPDVNLQVFLFRARRAGLSVAEIVEEIQSFEKKNGLLSSTDGRLDLIDCLMKRKMRQIDKKFWGGKTDSDLYQLHSRHPDAVFFITVRDIRDVFASMLHNGSFRYSASEATELWKQRILDFREFVRRKNPKAMEVRYEELATDPSRVLQNACEIIGVEYSPAMLSFNEKEMTLFSNPHGHLSVKQIQKGLNSDSIGRWRRDLSDEQATTIMASAGELLRE